MNQYVKRTQRDYPLSFKLAVVEQVEKGEMTYRQAQDRYGIQGRSTVLKWLRKFGQLDWLSPSPARMYGFQILRCSRLLVMQNGRITKRQTAIIVFTVTLTY
ncbi:helix-turn-helix domain protein [Yersinia enterocolitica]|nr:helix-turn-helix domain protein [Yersinia enterocolitica]CNK83321.1 transposase IS1669 [Yersinia enterocolitica]